MANKITISAAEKKWRAESDARTLSEALDIQKDAKRMAAAKKAAQDMIEATKKRYSFASSDRAKTNKKK